MRDNLAYQSSPWQPNPSISSTLPEKSVQSLQQSALVGISLSPIPGRNEDSLILRVEGMVVVLSQPASLQ